MEEDELASLGIYWLFNYHKRKKIWSHEIMGFLEDYEESPIRRIYATRMIEYSELVE